MSERAPVSAAHPADMGHVVETPCPAEKQSFTVHCRSAQVGHWNGTRADEIRQRTITEAQNTVRPLEFTTGTEKQCKHSCVCIKDYSTLKSNEWYY